MLSRQKLGEGRSIGISHIYVGDINLHYLSKYRCRKCTDIGLWREVGVECKADCENYQWAKSDCILLIFQEITTLSIIDTLLPKSLFCIFQGEHTFICTWSYFHLYCPPSLSDQLAQMQSMSVVSWSSTSKRMAEVFLSVLPSCLLWGWASAPSPWSCHKKHLWRKEWLSILI